MTVFWHKRDRMPTSQMTASRRGMDRKKNLNLAKSRLKSRMIWLSISIRFSIKLTKQQRKFRRMVLISPQDLHSTKNCRLE